MTALDHNHLVSRNCRDGYRCGPAPALLVSALLVALIIAFPGPAHSASFEPVNQSLLQPQAEQSGADMAVLDTGANATRRDPILNIMPGWNVYDKDADTSGVYVHGGLAAGIS